MSSGCGLLQARLDPVDQSPVASEQLNRLAKSLEGDLWLPRPAWSPKREWETRQANRPAATALRWRFRSDAFQETWADLEDELALTPEDAERFPPEDLLAELATRNDLAGCNAAILWAQRRPERATVLERDLERLVRNPPRYVRSLETPAETVPVSRSLQAAAAEAWCLVLAEQLSNPISALAPAGRALVQADCPDEVRQELFRGIARWVPPANVPGLNEALPEHKGSRPNPPALRQAAMEACVIYALWNPRVAQLETNDRGAGVGAKRSPQSLHSETNGSPGDSPWPAVLLDWQWEPDAYFESDPAVRRLFAHWMALVRHPNAAALLESHLADENFSVRDEALINLGLLQTEEALATLKKQAKRPEPRVRAMAVKGLAHWGVRAIEPLVRDESQEVRQSVAEALAQRPTLEAALRLRELQADSSRQVETAALDASRHWPDELAVPILLHGMQHATLSTRRQCFRELRRRTGLQESFPIAAGPEVRSEAARALARAEHLPLDLLPAGQPLHPDAKVNHLRVAELREYLEEVTHPEVVENSANYQAALRALKEASPEDVPAIEAFLLNRPTTTPATVVLTQVLPALSSEWAALAQLDSEDPPRRHAAARELLTLAEKKSLSPLVVRLLRTRLQAEADPLLWRHAMQSILPDNNPETARLAAWAANSSDAGIRQLACEFAARHKQPPFAEWLLPLLHDSHPTVRLAAIEAAGRCRNRLVIDGLIRAKAEESLPGLRPLLADRDPRVQRAAAIAMSQLGDPKGHDELIRLSHHEDARVRREVMAAMGPTGQTRFIEHLISVGWTDRDDAVKRAVLKSLHQLIPEEKHPPALANTTGTDDKIILWADWWQQSEGAKGQRGKGAK